MILVHMQLLIDAICYWCHGFEMLEDHAITPRRAQKRDQKRSAILDAAEGIFGSQGLQKTTMGDIAAAAEVSRPLLYRYFRDKEALFEAVVGRVVREWNEVLLAEAARATPGTAHTMRLVLIASLDFARERDVLRGLLGRDSRLALSDYSDVIDEGNSMLRRLVEEILRAGVLHGDVRSDLNTEDLAHVVTEVFLAYADHIVLGESDELGERRVEAILETLLHGLIVKPASGGRLE
jgi:AcrR family transcriptional regulator